MTSHYGRVYTSVRSEAITSLGWRRSNGLGLTVGFAELSWADSLVEGDLDRVRPFRRDERDLRFSGCR